MLAAGMRLGPYEILGHLGSGGMGEVYRARDPRLARQVAVKVLPAEFAAHSSRRARFEQEARAAGSLNQPGIVALYDIGEQEGVLYLVTELVEGQTLRAVLESGPLPLRKALDMAAHVAESLAAAHAAGIAHRDLKPENIMVTQGRTKILDFGLAKPFGAAGGETRTLSLTQDGVTMGTPGYMSPEQVRGTAADRRSDIFSFGLVLYEMLSGRRAYHAETSAETLTAILKADPPELPAEVPAAVRQVVMHCLEKEPGARFQSAQDLAFALRALAGASSASQAVAAIPAGRPRRRWRLAGAVAAAALVGIAAGVLLAPGDPSNPPALRFTPVAADPESEAHPAFSPDGKSVAYVKGFKGGGRDLFVRSLDVAMPTQLTHGVRASYPFWSPDGALVYFSADRGFGQPAPLWYVSSAGGTPVHVLDDCLQPILSRDSKHLVFARRQQSRWRLLTSSLSGTNAVPLEDGWLPAGSPPLAQDFAPDGKSFLVVVKEQVWSVPFPSGTARRLRQIEPASAVRWFPDGRHVALLGPSNLTGHEVVLADTRGATRRALLAGPETVISMDLSRDGRRLAYSSGFPRWDIVEFGMDGKRRGDLVATTRTDFAPHWAPQGDRLVFMSDVLGPPELWIQSADGQRRERLVSAAAGNLIYAWPRFSPDGNRVAYVAESKIWVVPSNGGAAVMVMEDKRARAVSCRRGRRTGLGWRRATATAF